MFIAFLSSSFVHKTFVHKTSLSWFDQHISLSQSLILKILLSKYFTLTIHSLITIFSLFLFIYLFSSFRLSLWTGIFVFNIFFYFFNGFELFPKKNIFVSLNSVLNVGHFVKNVFFLVIWDVNRFSIISNFHHPFLPATPKKVLFLVQKKIVLRN